LRSTTIEEAIHVLLSVTLVLSEFGIEEIFVTHDPISDAKGENVMLFHFLEKKKWCSGEVWQIIALQAAITTR
jgi:hypothetical protein